MLIKVGSKGPEVKKIQEKLGLGADGVFGPGTESAIKKWQKENGLTDDGLVGSGTWSKMFPGEAVPQAPAPVELSPFKLENLEGKIPAAIYAELPSVIERFNCNNIFRLAHLGGQCHHESAGFKILKENLNYSADGLRKIFGKYFPTDELAQQYARKPEKIANRVYGNRMGNGPESSGDGYKYFGRGGTQLTGYHNYKQFSDYIGDPEIMTNPDLVATKYALSSAGFFFNVNKLWTICDRGVDEATITAVTKRVNGGTHGLQQRIEETQKYYNLLKA